MSGLEVNAAILLSAQSNRIIKLTAIDFMHAARRPKSTQRNVVVVVVVVGCYHW